jgi:putative hemolysin
MGFEPVAGHAQVHSAEELEMLVKSSREAGLLQESEERLLRRVFDFSDIQAREVMQPRVEVEAIALETPLSKLLQTATHLTHSRFPVYEETIDRVIGILHTRDLFDLVVGNPSLLTMPEAKFDLKSLLRSPMFVPETAGVDKLLEKMQQTKTQFAVIIDEYGGMAGVVTMEDILEQLIGQVQDEFDTEAADIETEGDAVVIDGLVSITELNDRFGDPGIEPLSNTLGGYVAERLDRIPTVNDKVKWGDYELVVEEMDGMRVAKVRFIPPSKQTSSEEVSQAASNPPESKS